MFSQTDAAEQAGVEFHPSVYPHFGQVIFGFARVLSIPN
jgi:hypothetical protein